MAMVELEPVPEEEAVNETRIRRTTTISRSHGRVDIMSDLTTSDAERLHKLIADHARYTGFQARGRKSSADWTRYRPLFRKVMPVEYRRALAEMAKEKAAAMQAAE